MRDYEWARAVRDQAVQKASYWRNLSDEELWNLMFGPSIKRSWMVWSDGYCPSCKESVPMYNWEMDALHQPWKVRCPHCRELFPKNDFKKFYDSGINEAGVFDPNRANRSLLYNEEHPDPDDPQHLFGVDDGEGYVEREAGEEHRWRFVGAYLIYGQWKQAVRDGIVNLANAFTLTADPIYAHKAAILLDRVADFYPDFDFKEQGILYEGPGSAGYVTTWHDACEETREMALAYDQVFEGIENDRELTAFLSSKAKTHGIENPKNSIAQIRQNIEDRILQDAIDHSYKIHSNYPRQEICIAVIRTVLGWPGNRSEVLKYLDEMIRKATAVDGVTGEKGLANYSAFVIQSLAEFLGLYTRMDASFLADLMRRHPNLRKTYRFHVDTWCGQRYYPLSGDTGWLGKTYPKDVGVNCQKIPSLVPSMFSFLWSLYEETGDTAYAQVLYSSNEGSTAGLPFDLFSRDPAEFQSQVEEVIRQTGPIIPLKSVNKQAWHLAILRSGSGTNERSLWVDYDSEGAHCHQDGMNVGLFAKGLDLLPDLGYPPVQFGGWGSERSNWYRRVFSHNTVVVDRQNQKPASGVTRFFADGQTFHTIQVSGPEIYGVSTYERTLVLIDVDPENSYGLDLFRVSGGAEHTRLYHSFFGKLRYQGFNPTPCEPWIKKEQMRRFMSDPQPERGWRVDWTIEDRYHVLDSSTEVHFRLTDLTPDCQVTLAESWVNPGGFMTSEEDWIPTVLTQRSKPEGNLESEFVAVLEPYVGEPLIGRARRTEPSENSGTTVIEVFLKKGGRDVFLYSSKGEHSLLEYGKDHIDARLAWLRYGNSGQVERFALVDGTGGSVGNRTFLFDEPTGFFEAEIRK